MVIWVDHSMNQAVLNELVPHHQFHQFPHLHQVAYWPVIGRQGFVTLFMVWDHQLVLPVRAEIGLFDGEVYNVH